MALPTTDAAAFPKAIVGMKSLRGFWGKDLGCRVWVYGQKCKG